MKNKNQSYWKSNLKVVFSLLSLWFIASYGFGIIFSDFLDQIKIGGFKLGFWSAQQGSIFVFVILIFVYVILMNRLDKKFNSKDKLETYLSNGAKKVIVSAPCKNADKTVVFGVNESELNNFLDFLVQKTNQL